MIDRKFTTGLLSLLTLFIFIGAVGERAWAYDHEKDDGHSRRVDPEDEPEDEDPPEEPEDPCEATGSPVYLRSGNLVLGFQDISWNNVMGLEVGRAYNSQDSRPGLLGLGWTHSLDIRVIPTVHAGVTEVLVRWPTGQRHHFTLQPDGTFSKPVGCPVELNQTATGYEIIQGEERVYETDLEGNLLKITNRTGQEAVFMYDATGCLTTVQTPDGDMTISRGANGRFETISAPCGQSVTYGYDALGQLVTVQDSGGFITSYAYDVNGDLTTVTNPLGQVTMSVTYDAFGRVNRLIDRDGDNSYSYLTGETQKTNNADGGVWRYLLDAQGVVTTLINPLGDTTTSVFDSQYNLTSLTDGNGNVTTHTYDADGHRLSTTDALGNVSTFTYDAMGQLATGTDPLGNVTTWQYDAMGSITQIEEATGDALQRSASFTYDSAGNMTSTTDFDGNTMSYTFDARGNRTSMTDGLGNVTSYTYDTCNKLISTQEPGGRTITNTYDVLGQLTAVSDDLGAVTSYTYDAAGNQVSMTSATGGMTTFTYDAQGNITSIIDGNGDLRSMTWGPHGVTQYVGTEGDYTYREYDVAGQLTREIKKVGDTGATADGNDGITDFVRDGVGNPTSVADAAGNTIVHVYDALNRAVTTTTPSGTGTTYSFDANGNMLTRTLGASQSDTFAYDNLNRVTMVTDVVGTKLTNAYGASDLPNAETDGAGATTSYSYDAVGRTILRTYANGSTEAFVYDANGRAMSLTDKAGGVITYTRDIRGRITSATDPTGETISATYDLDGNIVTITDALGNVTAYTYDAVGRRISETYPDGSFKAMTYDGAGRLLSQTQRDASLITFAYDERGNLSQRVYPDGNTDTFTYGVSNEMLTATNNNSTVSFAYDSDGRMISETLNGNVTSYAYDAMGLTRTLTYPSGRVIQEVYDQRERLSGLLEGAGGSSISMRTYNGANQLATQALTNGTMLSTTFDTVGNPAVLAHSNGGGDFAAAALSYSANDKLVTAMNTVDASASRTFAYDGDDRLTAYAEGTLSGGTISTPTRAITYNLDDVANWTSVVRDGTTENTTINNLNQYTAFGAFSPTYNANGSLTDDGTYTYTYDGAGRLETTTRNAGNTLIATFTYDALGRRISKLDEGGTLTEFIYSDRLNVIEEIVSAATTATYVWATGWDDLVSMQRGGNDYYYHRDYTGSVVAVTDAAGDVAEQYSYDPYGSVEIEDGSGTPLAATAIGNPYLFTGRRYDAESETYFYRSRNYHPAMGRFFSEDPAGMVDGVNLYEYATSDPINKIDPLGLAGKSCKVAGSVEFDASGKLQKLFGKVIGAFGLNFEVGGGVKLEIKGCEGKCCEDDTPKTITWKEYSLTANLKMEFAGPIPGLAFVVPLVGNVGLNGSIAFSIEGSGAIESTLSKSCKLTQSGKACVKPSGSVALFLGGVLSPAPGVDPFSGKVGVEGKATLFGELCYGTSGWSGQACLQGTFSVVAEFQAFWVKFGGSYEIINKSICSSFP